MDHAAVMRRLHDRARETGSDAFIVLKDGRYLNHCSFERDNQPILIMSITKLVVGLTLGKLFAKNTIRLDQPVADYFPEWRQGRKRHITIAMLLNHTSGLQNDSNAGAELESAPDWVQLALCAELDHAPGTTFAYNNKAVMLVAGLVERLIGVPLDQFVDEVLFQPLGITDVAWFRDERNTPYACGGLSLSGTDLARIGQVVLDGGRAGTKQVIDPDWIATMSAPGQPFHSGFGLLCRRWLDPASGALLGICHDGWLGQYLVICPRSRIVIVRLISRDSSARFREGSFDDMLSLAKGLAHEV